MYRQKGGYIIIDLGSTTLVAELTKALGLGKPILIYDADGKANFYELFYDDTLGSEQFILKGVETTYFVAEDDGTITDAPTIVETKLYEHRVKGGTANCAYYFTLVSKSSTALTYADIQAIIDKGDISVTGYGIDNGTYYPAFSLTKTYLGYRLSIVTGSTVQAFEMTGTQSVTDVVTEL